MIGVRPEMVVKKLEIPENVTKAPKFETHHGWLKMPLSLI
jgi:hypothetical protein